MKNIIYILTFIIASFIGCSGTISKVNDDPQPERISIQRFDIDLYNYIQFPDSANESDMKIKYPALLPAFGRIAIDNSDPITLLPSLREYFAHPALLKLYNDTESTFRDVSSYEDQLTAANEIVKEKFNGKRLPQFAMHVSGFRENVIILNNLISISADKYLGPDYTMYQEFFQQYERQQMQPKYMVRDYLRAWLMSDMIKQSDDKNLLAAMVNEGKVLYALSILLPETDIKDITGYTDTQFSWLEENEKESWKTILNKNYLFSTDNMIITRFMNDAPFTMPLSIKTPGRAGSWFGWRMVSKYAKNKKVSLEEILNTDAATILKDAKYNP